jgi:hypothetical protein
MRTNFKRIIATVFAILCLLSAGNAQSLLWDKHWKPSGFNGDSGEDVHKGDDGMIYVAGALGSGTIVDAFVTSYTMTGNQNWVSTYAGTGGAMDYFYAVKTYGSGTGISVYAAGYTNTNSNGNDILLAKYDWTGSQQWLLTWNNAGVSHEGANCLELDASGNIYVGGSTSTNGGDLLYQKYSSSGNLLWSTTFNSSGTQEDSPQYMRYHPSDYLYMASIRKVSGTDHNAVVQKVDATTGSIVWTAVWDGGLANDIDEIYSLDFGPDGNIYVVGTTQTPNSGYDALLLKYDPSGTLLCASTWNNPTYNLDDILGSIDVHSIDNAPVVFVTGYTQIDPGTNDADYLTMKFNCGGATWVATYDGAGIGCPFANDDWAHQILVSTTTGHVYVTGRSYETNASLNATTIKYDPVNGNQLWIHSYDRGNTDNQPARKYPLELEYDDCHDFDIIYVTGYTRENGPASDLDATTLMYGSYAACNKLAAPGTGNEPVASGIYPNPFSNSAVFRCNTEGLSDASLVIYDITGRVVKRMDNIGTNEFGINSEGLNGGMYFYRLVQGPELIYTGKFVIEK